MAAKKKKPAAPKGRKKPIRRAGSKKAAAKKPRVKLVPVRQRRPSSGQEAPDVSIVTGPVIPATAQEKTERELGEQIARVSAEIDAGRGSPETLNTLRERQFQLERKKTAQKFEFPQYGFDRKQEEKDPCAWKGMYKKGGGKKAPKPMHVGRVELAILNEADSDRIGLPIGPAVRLCVKPNEPAPIVSVTDPVDALNIATDFRDCAVRTGDPKTCSLQAVEKYRGLAPDQVKIAGAPRRRRSR